MVKEPVSNGRVVGNCLAATGTAVFLVWTDEASQLGPLAISSTVSEEHSGHSQSVHHGDQPAPLLEPELAGPSKAAGKVHHSVGEEINKHPDDARLTLDDLRDMVGHEGEFESKVSKRGCLANRPSPYIMRCWNTSPL